MLTDFVVTGHPLFSLQHTSGLAEELGRTQGPLRGPGRRCGGSSSTWPRRRCSTPAIAGFLVALWLAPRRALMPCALWLIGIGTFVLVGVAGLSVIDRYLLVPTLMVMVFAAVALGGWTMLREGLLIAQASGRVAAAAIVVYGVVFTATRVNFHNFDSELKLRGNSHRSLVELLDQPAVRDAPPLRAGLDAQPQARARRALDPRRRRPTRSSRAPTTPRRGAIRQAASRCSSSTAARCCARRWWPTTDDPFDNLPLPGFKRLAFTDYYAAYVRC